MTRGRWAAMIGGMTLLAGGLAAGGLAYTQGRAIAQQARDAEARAAAERPRPVAGLVVPGRADEAVLREAVARLAAAWNKGDVDALLAAWTDDAEFITEAGRAHRGKEALRALLKKGLESYKGHKQSIKITSIRFIRPDVAVEEGVVTLTSPEGVPDAGKYEAMWLKQGGKWLIVRMRDLPGDEENATPAYSRLKPLSWLIGEWADKEGTGKVRLTCRWAPDQTFIVQEYTIKQADGKDLKVTQWVGYDPASDQLRSWMFDSTGGFSGGLWTREGNAWAAQSEGVLADGQTATAVMRVQYQDEDSFLYTARDRQVEGQPLPDLSIAFVRKPKAR